MADGYAEVAELARKMRVYIGNTVSAVSFFTFGMLIAAYFLVLTPFPRVFAAWPLVVGGLVAVVAAGVVVIGKFTPRGYRSEDGWKELLSFSIPFALYAVPNLYPGYAVLALTMWYPSLGLALLLYHLTAERGRGGAKPFLLASLLMLATSPLVLYLTLVKGVSIVIMATGLMLLAYYMAGAYALYEAHKALLGSR